MKEVVKSVKTEDHSIGTIVDRFSSVCVLVVGDVLLDRFHLLFEGDFKPLGQML